jgi:hypothetical protein
VNIGRRAVIEYVSIEVYVAQLADRPVNLVRTYGPPLY